MLLQVLAGMGLMVSGVALLTQTDAALGPLVIVLAGLLLAGARTANGTTVEEG